MKFIYLILIVLLITSIVTAQEKKISESEVPKVVVDSFRIKYPEVKTIRWVSEDNNYEVTFKLEGIKYEANYSSKGEWIETARTFKKLELPDSVKTTLQSGDYAKWKIISLQKVETPEYKLLYMVEVSKNKESKELYFTPEGVLVKEE